MEVRRPQIDFAAPVFDFGKIKQGEIVRHNFVFKNTGNAPLEITAVNPGCGCTTAGEWDKRVDLGQRGVIPLQFNSAGFSGDVAKAVTITTNDPRKPSLILQIKGDVWTPFAVSPTIAVFNVSSETESSETKVVRIVSQLEEPVQLTSVEGGNAALRTELTILKPGKEFELKVTAVPPFRAGSNSMPLTVKTSTSEAPTLSVLAQVIVHPPVVVTPERITLPYGPLTGTTTMTVIVRNNGKNSLELSDAKMNVPGGSVTVTQVQSGKLFQLMVKFPPGYQPLPADLVNLSVKSNHPKFGMIRVPVVTAPANVVTPVNVSGVEPKK